MMEQEYTTIPVEGEIRVKAVEDSRIGMSVLGTYVRLSVDDARKLSGVLVEVADEIQYGEWAW